MDSKRRCFLKFVMEGKSDHGAQSQAKACAGLDPNGCFQTFFIEEGTIRTALVSQIEGLPFADQAGMHARKAVIDNRDVRLSRTSNCNIVTLHLKNRTLFRPRQ